MRVYVIKQQGKFLLKRLLYFREYLSYFLVEIMTILPKKKHQDSKKNEANTSNDLRHARSRNNCARTSGERANRSPDEINESSVYRSGNIELRNTSESSSNGKRRYRNTNNEYRRRDETGYNSEDEYDASKNDDQPSEEVVTACLPLRNA